MGRSVSYPSGAVVAYAAFDAEDGDYTHEFERLIDCFRDTVKSAFPSTWGCDTWLGREDHALMCNNFAVFGISEYCGLVAYWVVVDPALGDASLGLAEAWVRRIAPKFQSLFGTLDRLGTMSNGEGVFQWREVG